MAIDPVSLYSKAKKIRLLILDVDGVLTDGRIVYNQKGEQIHFFHVHDGFGIKLLLKAGLNVSVISARKSPALSFRATELGIEKLYAGVKDKPAVYMTLLKELCLGDEEVCYVGDDWLDIPLLKKAGLSVTVPGAAHPVKDFVHYVTSRPGGSGAVREVCDLILKAQDRWTDFLSSTAGFPES